MGLSFSKYLAIHEIFQLDRARVLSLAEVVEPPPSAADQLARVRTSYRPDPAGSDHLAAVCAGLKPAAIVSYIHHPDSPAAAVVSDKLRKDHNLTAGEVQAELLKHGFKVRPDFHIIHMDLPNYSSSSIIVGGRAAVEELWQLLRCQFYLDLISSPDHPEINQDVIQQMNKKVLGQCRAYCNRGTAGLQCKPIHKRIGELLGYTDEQIHDFLQSMTHGQDTLPDIDYPMGLPQSLAGVPRRNLRG